MKISSYVGDYTADFYDDFSFLQQLDAIEHKFIVIDKNILSLYEKELGNLVEGNPHYLLTADEEHKTLNEVQKVIEQMLDMPSRRNTVLISVGGGVCQDVSSLTANIIYRGIKWIFLPTTLLAQADSCIGSKSSINFDRYKNILGYFYPPTKIYINTKFLHSLQTREFLSGLGEIVKCALMAGYDSFLDTRQNLLQILSDRNTAAAHKTLLKEIEKALAFKKVMIEIDEFDRGKRNIMNFGHTFGHALEVTSDYTIPHGQAVSTGIMIANEISLMRGYISEEVVEETSEFIQKIITLNTVKKDFFTRDSYLTILKKDKKYTGTTHNCILFHGNEVKKHGDVTDEEVMTAVENFFARNG